MRILLTAIVCLLVVQICLAQYDRDHNEQYRDVTAAGPFPYYLTAHASAMIGNRDMKKWVGQEDARFLKGVGFDLGLKIKRAVFFETGYWHVSASPKGTENRMTINSYSARMGWRKTVFYPFGMHFQAGVLLRDTRFRTEIPGPERQVHSYRWQWGADTRLRLTLLDPVGTGGGMGFYIEGRAHFMLGNQVYELPGDVEFKRNDRYGAISLGLMMPIAVRRVN